MRKIIVFGVMITTLLIIAYYQQILAVLITVVYIIMIMLAIIFVISVILLTWYASEKLKEIRATRIKLEREAHVMTVTANGQVFVRDTDNSATWRAMHLQQSVIANGRYCEPKAIEAQAWQIFNAPKTITPNQPNLLSETTEEKMLDLLTIMDTEQRVLIKGVSNAGKTNLLRWIAQRKQVDSKILVIDPHASPDMWNGCTVVGKGSNHDEIADALNSLIDLMVKRYQEIGEGTTKEGEHQKICVIIDEWMSIAYQSKNAKQVMVRLLTESRKAAFSVFVGSHSDRIASLGLDGKGDLRDGFCLVRLSLIEGTRTATVDYGGKEMETILPPKFITNFQVIESDFIDLETKPDDRESKILDLHSAGISYNEIAKQVYGNKGGYQTNRIKNILAKFSTV